MPAECSEEDGLERAQGRHSVLALQLAELVVMVAANQYEPPLLWRGMGGSGG